MSVCISSRGEYGSHVLDDAYTCTWCGVLDEDAMTAELRQLRELREAVRHVDQLVVHNAPIAELHAAVVGLRRYIEPKAGSSAVDDVLDGAS